MENVRELALSLLMEIYAQKEFSHILIRRMLDRHGCLSRADKAFVKRLAEGTLERTLELDYVLNRYCVVKTQKMKPFIRTLLRMSVYQLLYLDKTPDSAVCNEAVKLAQRHRFSSLKGFVNGTLRTIAREKGSLVYPDREKEPMEYLSVRYSLPLWLVEFFLNRYGQTEGERLMAAFQEERPLTLRLKEELNEERIRRLLEGWKAQGAEAVRHPYLPYAYTLTGTEGPGRLAGYAEGDWAVQDVSSMLACEAAGIRPGMEIVDVCAAPGGKAVHSALKLKGTGRVWAGDVSEARAALIRENAARQGVANLTVEVRDARVRDEAMKEKADILLCDLPCSGLGIMGRKRDIRYRITPEKMKELAALQRTILEAVWAYVKPGGVLMYSSCTINEEENEAQVRWLMQHFPFRAVSMKEYLPEALRAQETPWGLQLLPGKNEADGFFLAKLIRREEEG